MAQTWQPKAPTEVVERRWTVPVDSDDGLASFTTSVAGVTLDSSETQGDDAVFYISAGTNGTIGSITITATTSQSRVLVETFYIPVQVSTLAFDDTANDIVSFALRKVKGVRGTATATEAADALERLNMMLAAWKVQGADVGAMLPLDLTDRLYCEDAFLDAIKANLVLKLADLYGFQPAPTTVLEARQGLALIKNAQLSRDTLEARYY